MISLQLRAKAELEKRRRRQILEIAHRQPALTFREFIRKVNPRYQFYAHVEKLIDILQRVADGELNRVMIFMPPRHSKSETTSRLFTAYYLYRHPDRFVGLSSYGASLAYTLSRNARENYRAICGNPATEGVEQWETGSGGGMWAAGVGGPITGKGANLLVIDDPLKNAEEAQSETIREKQKDWWGSTLYSRQEPDAAIVVIQTRWHEDDLSGWLLAQEDQGEYPERWHIVRMEAIKEETGDAIPATCTMEPDEREPDEALCPERYDLAKLTAIRAAIGPYYFSALYQQTPRPREGNFFKRAWFEIVEAAPAVARRVRWWDRAATAGGGDWTVGLLMAKAGGIYYVEDVIRGQWSSSERDAVIRQTAQMDHARYGGAVHQWAEQEPGSSGKDAAAAFVSMLAGFAAFTEPSTGDKAVRADPYAAQAGAGNVKIVLGPWNRAYLDELTSFPSGKADDQVDASSGAFNKLSAPVMAAPLVQAKARGW